jgi:hypothetical protein
MVKKEGMMRFWSGIRSSVVGSFPGQASYFLAYEAAQEVMSKSFPENGSDLHTFINSGIAGSTC